MTPLTLPVADSTAISGHLLPSIRRAPTSLGIKCGQVWPTTHVLTSPAACYYCSGIIWNAMFFFFKQKTAYEIGLGIPAEPLFRSSTTSIDIMGLQAAYANLHTDQERDYFMQRYHDVISSFGGKTSYDADNRPLLVMRSNLWASGYDVDGTDQTSLG